ncbi:hypothetical protein ACJ2CR_08285 [Myxococcus faecalis]|uniref:hypothetical protein n=1 Tax=Myxococcus faecalis TaxID=3115646 RepID=UPI0038D0B675
MPTRAALSVVLLLIGALACACATTQAADADQPPRPKTTVQVESRKTVDVNLYALNGARRVRLGTVPGMSSRSFVLPPDMVGVTDRVRFGVEIIGTFGGKNIGSERRFESEQEISVQPGEEVTLTLY